MRFVGGEIFRSRVEAGKEIAIPFEKRRTAPGLRFACNHAIQGLAQEPRRRRAASASHVKQPLLGVAGHFYRKRSESIGRHFLTKCSYIMNVNFA